MGIILIAVTDKETHDWETEEIVDIYINLAPQKPQD